MPAEDSLFAWRRVLGVPVWVQVLIVLALWTTAVLLAHAEYTEHGTSFGYAGPATLTLFVPIYEELVFRGFVLTALLRGTGPKRAILFSSLLFGLWHLKNISWHPSTEALVHQMVYAGLVVGPILAWVTLRLRTLWPAVMLHYANNLLGTYVVERGPYARLVELFS